MKTQARNPLPFGTTNAVILKAIVCKGKENKTLTMKKNAFILALLFVLALPVFVHADVFYTYSGGQGPGGLNGMSFQYQSPTFVTYEDLQIPLASLNYYSIPPTDNYGRPLAGLEFAYSSFIFDYGTEAPYGGFLVYFPDQSFQNFGTYNQMFFGAGTLTVSQTGAIAVPEPPISLLFGTALGVLGLVRRKLHC